MAGANPFTPGEVNASGPVRNGVPIPPNPGYQWIRPPDRDGVSQGWIQIPIGMTFQEWQETGYRAERDRLARESAMDKWRKQQAVVSSSIRDLTQGVISPADTAIANPTQTPRFRNKWRRKNNTQTI